MHNKFLIILLSTTLIIIAICISSLVYTKIRPVKIERSIEINASASSVWEVLSDFDKYPEWNPFIVSAMGDIRVGGQLTNVLRNKGSEMTFKPTILVANPGHELRWIGRFGFPGVVDGEHYFLIEQIDSNTVRFTQGESFSGFLVPVAGPALDVADSFDAMNRALKERVE